MSVLDTQDGLDDVRDFIEQNEGDRLNVYLDSENIPTVGIGYALITNQGGAWVVRPDLVTDLRDAGILGENENLTASDLQRLQDAATNLNNGNGTNNQNIIDNNTSWDFYPDGQSSLTDAQTGSLFDNIIGDYENIVIDRLRQGAGITRQQAERLERVYRAL
ncbi:lysozyme family protein [Marinagarivorans algicola]|uniref:hypothetical protein n=1 Tax=Marinagarivorans algicola TaxID=1513270 RepID=UPI003735276B